LTKESTILLLESKLLAYKNGFMKAKAKNDETSAKKWKDGYIATRDRIYNLKHQM